MHADPLFSPRFSLLSSFFGSCAELIAAMAVKGYWSSPRGRTPAGTLYAAILRELQSKGEKARFGKTERDKFRLNSTL
jgi:hypothetical protein